jgi:outer membrane lipoprotein-sorting protein
MRRRIVIPVVAVVVLAAVIVGALLLTSRSRAAAKTTSATTPSALTLLSDVASHLQNIEAVHGQLSWTNGVLGQAFTLPAQAPAQLKNLWGGGSGEFWYQNGMVRLQLGNGADQVIVGKNGSLLWVYSAQTNTATEYTLPVNAGHAAQPQPSSSPGLNIGNLPSGVTANLAQLMSAVELNVTQGTVSGQSAYILTVTPTAANTTVGSVDVAFDTTTYLPLRLQVFAKGQSAAVLSAQLTNVSYTAVAATEFMPPANATIVKGTLPAKDRVEQALGKATGQQMTSAALSLKQVEAQAGFPLLSPGAQVSGLAFQDAHLLPAAASHGKVAVLRYGTGAGTVVLAEGQFTAAQEKRTLAALTAANLAQSVTLTVSGSAVTGEEISTPLVNALMWTTGGVVHIAAGAVPLQTLQAFVSALQ